MFETLKKNGISADALKWIALITMLIDHIAAVLLTRLYLTGGLSYSGYGIILALRLVGRVAFPIYCFLFSHYLHYIAFIFCIQEPFMSLF